MCGRPCVNTEPRVQVPCKQRQLRVQAVQALCKGCENSASAVQVVQMASGHPALHGTAISRDGVFLGWCPGVAAVSLHSVCVHTEQSRWLALETRSRYCDKTPVKLQQKEIQEATVTNAREKRLFRGGEVKKKKPCLFWRNTYIPSNKSSQRLFLYLRRNRNRHNQGLKRLEITS